MITTIFIIIITTTIIPITISMIDFLDYFHPCDYYHHHQNHHHTYISIERSLSMQFFSIQKEAIDAYVLCFNHYFKRLLPLLYQHMSSEGIVPEMYLMDWIMSLFTKVDADVWIDGWMDRGMEGWLSKVCICIIINHHNHRNHHYYHQHHYHHYHHLPNHYFYHHHRHHHQPNHHLI